MFNYWVLIVYNNGIREWGRLFAASFLLKRGELNVDAINKKGEN